MYHYEYKRARVTLMYMYKAGEQFLLNNYRQVFVLPVISKLFERPIHNKVLMSILDIRTKYITLKFSVLLNKDSKACINILLIALHFYIFYN